MKMRPSSTSKVPNNACKYKYNCKCYAGLKYCQDHYTRTKNYEDYTD